MSTLTKKLWPLFATFFKIGAFTFGGGYAMIPLIQKEAVEKQRWVEDSDILEIVAIAESTPGPIAINAATFIGYRVSGVFGAICATLGVVLPSFVIILIMSGILQQFQDIVLVQYAFFGIRAGVLALILKAMWGMYKKSPKDIFSYLIMLGVFLAVVLLKASVLWVLALAAGVGLAVTLCRRRAEK